ncbi:contractile injection system protein, VgrG/Pvc8 family [Burkholderia glumae]|uniref:contractile injection system protein, VgrG/Pvc8 family n=1 Tax=Burkholderia glumae TaxID=337 RepID=UPI000C26E3AC|nr:contractile injection system protein, VgrG/Pvc8 family [Burkholderia glumae]PJO21155.1 type IV secretion protein Rhs [Burkholderia glumae AU6208]QHE13373.1 type IV secretion protein Rhs [Burkholderia glumae AU6208]
MSDLASADARSFSVNRLAPPEPAVYLHCAVFIDRHTVLGAETFRLQSFQGQESVSEPFEYQLELVANSDGERALPVRFDELIGRAITVGIGKQVDPDWSTSLFRAALEGGVAPDDTRLSLFNGIVTSFAVKNRGTYAITMKPALHRLGLTNNYRVFHGRTVWEMIELLLDAHHVAYAPFQHSQRNLAVIRRQDWMQAGETDLEFLKRLMSKALLHFYFVHSGNGHALVFSNTAQYPEAVPGGRPLRYTYSDARALGMEQEDVVGEFSMKKSMGSTGVHGVLTQQDGAWLANPVVEFNSFYADDNQDANPLPFNLYKSYQYGGSKEEAQSLSSITRSTLDGSRHELSGASNCARLRVGHRFRLTSGAGPTNPVEPFLEDGAFVLTAVQHQASADGSYRNQFQAGDAAYLITPYSIQATQQGSVLAEVVPDPAAQAQTAIDFGARQSFSTGGSSFSDALNDTAYPQTGVYVRFSTAPRDAAPVWVKLSGAMQTAPTVGSIVVVGRAQDESELPEIQNIIQTNGSQLVVPGSWLSSTRIGNNYSTSYGDNQSISYGAHSPVDLKQATRIVTDAYRSGRFDNTSFSEGAGYSFSTSSQRAPAASADSGELYGADPVAPDIVSASESFGSTYGRQIGSVSYNHSHFDKSISDAWVQTEKSTRYTGDSTSVSVGLSSTSMASMGTASSVSVTGTSISSNLVGASISANFTGSSISTSMTGSVIDSSIVGDTVRSSVSGNLMEDSVSGNTVRNTVSGNLVETSESGNVTRNSLSGDLIENTESGDITRDTIAGVVTENGVVVSRNGVKTEGAVEEMDVKGSHNLCVTAGSTTRVETSGATSQITTTAEITLVETAGPGARVSNNDETPHIDNIVTRIYMIEAMIIFM